MLASGTVIGGCAIDVLRSRCAGRLADATPAVIDDAALIPLRLFARLVPLLRVDEVTGAELGFTDGDIRDAAAAIGVELTAEIIGDLRAMELVAIVGLGEHD